MWGVWFLVRVFLFGRVARLSQSGQSGLCVVVVAIVGLSIWFAIIHGHGFVPIVLMNFIYFK